MIVGGQVLSEAFSGNPLRREAMATPRIDPLVQPGIKIGHYRLRQEIGEGGMGVV